MLGTGSYIGSPYYIDYFETLRHIEASVWALNPDLWLLAYPQQPLELLGLLGVI